MPNKETLKTNATLPGSYAEFNQDDDCETFSGHVLVEVVDCHADEIQIGFTYGDYRGYLDIRRGDLDRAVKEFKKS